MRNIQEQTKLEYLISGNFDAKYGLEIRRNRYRPVGNSVRYIQTEKYSFVKSKFMYEGRV